MVGHMTTLLLDTASAVRTELMRHLAPQLLARRRGALFNGPFGPSRLPLGLGPCVPCMATATGLSLGLSLDLPCGVVRLWVCPLTHLARAHADLFESCVDGHDLLHRLLHHLRLRGHRKYRGDGETDGRDPPWYSRPRALLP